MEQWSIDEQGRVYHRLDALTKYVIAEMQSGREADDRLIAAAPDLLKALKVVYDWQAGSEILPLSIWEQIRAAITKAEGSSHA